MSSSQVRVTMLANSPVLIYSQATILIRFFVGFFICVFFKKLISVRAA